jgi:hypothetical protein
MSTDEKIVENKVGLLRLAETLSSRARRLLQLSLRAWLVLVPLTGPIFCTQLPSTRSLSRRGRDPRPQTFSPGLYSNLKLHRKAIRSFSSLNRIACRHVTLSTTLPTALETQLDCPRTHTAEASP